MIELPLGTEPVDCSEVVYRALKKAWAHDEPIPAEAFIRKIRQWGVEEAVSASRRKYTTARECRQKLNRMRGSASLHAGRVRALPLGIEVSPDPGRNAQGVIIDPGHCLLLNLPDPITEIESAEFAASQLIRIARYVTPDQEEGEYANRAGIL